MEKLIYKQKKEGVFIDTINIYLLDHIDVYIGKLYSGFLCQLIEKNHINGFFFIRYRDSFGFHLRLRLSLIDISTSEVLSYLKEADLEDGNSEFHKISKYTVSKYHPETNRYGGDAGLLISEAFFCENSRFVASYLSSNLRKSYHSKIYDAFVINTITTLAFLKNEEIPNFLETFRNIWMTHILNSTQIKDKDKLLSLFDKRYEEYEVELNEMYSYCLSRELQGIELEWKEKCEYYAEKFKSCEGLSHEYDVYQAPFLSVLDSLIHMTNNRLGINNIDESYISHLIYKSHLGYGR